MFKKKQTSSPLQIGIEHIQAEQFYCCWIDENRQPVQKILSSQNLEQFPDLLPTEHVRLIVALAPNHVWYKNQCLPQRLNEQEQIQHCRFLMEQELPVPTSEIWFDYIYTPLKEACRLEIFAVRKGIAQRELMKYSRFPVEVLDHGAFAIWRGFYFLQPEAEQALFVYETADYLLALAKQNGQLHWLQKNQPEKTSEKTTALLALAEEFCQRFQYQPQAYYCLSQQRPENWHFLDSEVSLMALGCALWRFEDEEEPAPKEKIKENKEEK